MYRVKTERTAFGLWMLWGLFFVVSVLFLIASIPGYFLVGFGTSYLVNASPFQASLSSGLTIMASLGGASLSIGLAVVLFMR